METWSAPQLSDGIGNFLLQLSLSELCVMHCLSFWGFSENLKSASIPGKWNQGGLYVRVKEESKHIFKAHEMTLNLIFIFGNCLFLHSNAKVI